MVEVTVVIVIRNMQGKNKATDAADASRFWGLHRNSFFAAVTLAADRQRA
jgi:hypothetical protein